MTASPSYTYIIGDTSNMQAFSNAVNAAGGQLAFQTCCGTTIIATVTGAVPTPGPPQIGTTHAYPYIIDVR